MPIKQKYLFLSYIIPIFANKPLLPSGSQHPLYNPVFTTRIFNFILGQVTQHTTITLDSENTSQTPNNENQELKNYVNISPLRSQTLATVCPEWMDSMENYRQRKHLAPAFFTQAYSTTSLNSVQQLINIVDSYSLNSSDSAKDQKVYNLIDNFLLASIKSNLPERLITDHSEPNIYTIKVARFKELYYLNHSSLPNLVNLEIEPSLNLDINTIIMLFQKMHKIQEITIGNESIKKEKISQNIYTQPQTELEYLNRLQELINTVSPLLEKTIEPYQVARIRRIKAKLRGKIINLQDMENNDHEYTNPRTNTFHDDPKLMLGPFRP